MEATDRMLNNAEDVATARAIFTSLAVMVDTGQRQLIAEYPFHDESLNAWFSVLYDKIDGMINNKGKE